MLKIAVMDHDEFSRDELIGETHIDIEDRWFSKKFRALEEVPIEKRQLRNPASCVSQGYIRLWTEVVTREEHTVKKKYDIAPKPPKVPSSIGPDTHVNRTSSWGLLSGTVRIYHWLMLRDSSICTSQLIWMVSLESRRFWANLVHKTEPSLTLTLIGGVQMVRDRSTGGWFSLWRFL